MKLWGERFINDGQIQIKFKARALSNGMRKKLMCRVAKALDFFDIKIFIFIENI